jgi:hypothetical protein
MISLTSAVQSSAPALASDRGYLAWTQPTYVLNGGTALPTAGTVYLRRLRRVPAGSVTSIVTYLSAGGSALTAGQCFAALYTSAGALVAQSVDQAAAWATGGMKTMNLSGGPFPIAAGDYYVGVWFNGTTGPSVGRSGSVTATLTNTGLAAPNLEAASADTSVTTLAPAPLGSQTSILFEWWFALA